MKTDDSSPRPSLRRPQDGAVLVVVLLAMIGLLGMGLAGLYLTSGSIQMNSNINMRNQALYVAEAGIQTAKGIINRTVLGSPDWNPDINGMLAGIHSPSGAVVATPSGYTDEIPGRAGTDPSDYGCSGKSSNGVSTRGAYLRDEDPPPSGFGCQTDPTAPLQPVYIGCYYPPKYSGSTLAYNEAPADPNAMSPTPTQYMGQYTLFIRQDLGECRLGGDNLTRDGNNIVVIRSEGTASDNRTKVVLEVTMSTNPNVQILSQGLATVCPAGAAGCDDNASVQQGITVGPPGGGGAGGTTGGSGGTTGSACSKTSDCPTGYFCCDGACMSATDNSLHCGACEAKCAGGHCCDNNCCASSGQACCNGPNGLTCVASQSGTTNSSCGFCGTDCTATSTTSCCPNSAGSTYVCVDETSDPNNCGKCGTKCSATQSCCAGNCVDETSDRNNCGKCGNSCGSAGLCCLSACCGSGQICCSGGCQADPGCPAITAIGVYGPWDSGVFQFSQWLNTKSKGCQFGNTPLETPSPGMLYKYIPAPPYTHQVIILLDVANNTQDLANFMAANKGYWYHSVGTSGYNAHGTMSGPLNATDAAALGAFVRGGGGLATTIGVSCDDNELAFVNQVLGSVTNNDPNNPTVKYVKTDGGICVFPNQTTLSGTWVSGQGPGFKTASSIANAITSGVTALDLNGAYAIFTSLSDSGTFSSYASAKDASTNSVYLVGFAGEFGSGRLNVWGDEWITYDAVWNNAQKKYLASKYWANVIEWLGQCPSTGDGGTP